MVLFILILFLPLYRTLLDNIKNQQHHLKQKQFLRKRKFGRQNIDSDSDDDDDDDDDDEAYGVNTKTNTTVPAVDDILNSECKSMLMELFRRSGPAKLPSILKHLFAFLEDPFSGKVIY